jgi:hypothetical protein
MNGREARESGRSRNATVAPTAAFAYVNNRSPDYCHVVTAMYFVMYICVAIPWIRRNKLTQPDDGESRTYRVDRCWDPDAE